MPKDTSARETDSRAHPAREASSLNCLHCALQHAQFKAFASFALDPCGFGSSCPAVCIVACFSGISWVIAVSVQSNCCK
ncbi:hypothetical protein NDU88_002904 [Pleurodeles waltl]|uniref:Uncharacterized protein n=1 Tax=Pleurodeles waltl TaxID=8319 RepID=A0AAV7PD35_PLEWA|nr:hypothetical protein NDU88_002904 [Pleurodeles waltl]